ncbi:transposase, partial [Algiphilus sp. W345]
HETAFYVCTRALSAPQAARAIRGHWTIENSLHYIRDVTLREDHCRVRHNPGVLARLRTLALNVLHHNRLPNL